MVTRTITSLALLEQESPLPYILLPFSLTDPSADIPADPSLDPCLRFLLRETNTRLDVHSAKGLISALLVAASLKGEVEEADQLIESVLKASRGFYRSYCSFDEEVF